MATVILVSTFSAGVAGSAVGTNEGSIDDSSNNNGKILQLTNPVDQSATTQIEVPKSEWDGQIFWQGQQVSIDLADAPEDTIYVREVTEYDNAGKPASTRMVRSVAIVNDTAIISTNRLRGEGDYVLRSGGEYLQSDGTWGELENSGVAEVIVQDLDGEFGHQEIQNIEGDSTVSLYFDSIRSEFSIAISGERDGITLSDAEIRDIFGSTTIDIRSGETFEIDFAGKNPGKYSFTFDVKDSTAGTTSEIDVFGEIIGPDEPPKYNLSLDNDGSTYSVAFPGPVNGTYNDIFENNMDGIKAVYQFDSKDNEWNLMSNTDFSESPDSLDTIVILTEGGEGPDEIPITIRFEVQDPPQPSQLYLSEGWNFVGASTFDDADTVLDRGSAETTVALDQFAEPEVGGIAEVNSFQYQTRMPHYDLSSDNPPTMSPFKGYFVFVTDSGALPSLLSGVETRQEADHALNATASP